MPHVLDSFVGRVAVYIESSHACLGTVEKVETDTERFRAHFKVVPDSFRCKLRFIRHPDDGPIEERLVDPPFGDTWDVMVPNKEFYLEDDHWQALFLWGGGFRVFFQPTFIERFAAGDVTWIDTYYGDAVDEDDGDTDDGS